MKKVSYIDSNLFSPKDAWDALSMAEKSEMMKVAVQNGITNLDDIRREYNEFAEGGNIYKKGGSKKKSPSISPAAQRAMRYFMDRGLADYQAAGLVGNLMRESGMSPTAVNSSSGAFGLAQWLGSRKRNIFAKYGNKPTFEQQLDYIWHELNSTHKRGLKALKNSRNAEEAARNAMGYYEFMAGPEGAIREMKKYGQDGEGSMRKGINNALTLMGMPIPKTVALYDEVPYTPQDTSIPTVTDIPEFIPLNPQAFNTTLPTYQRAELTFDEPVVQETPVSPYNPEEIERQERAEGLANLGRFLSYTNSEGTGNSLLDTIGILTSTPAVSTAVRNNYVPATTTPYNRGNNMRRAFESAVAFNRMMDATNLQNNPLPEYQFPISYADGGKIHIKPSHRGRLTELKKRTGKSEAELYKTGGPAVRKMITFARNARKWKHGLGGNLFDDGGSYSYTKPLDNVYVDSEGNLLDPNVPSARGSIRIPDVEVTANPIDVGRGKAARLYNDYGIASNDATSTPLTRNIHLNERGLDGATKAAAWMKDNPTLNNVGMALGATPFAVAGYPAFMAAGEGTATALANPYVDAALTSGFGAHGLQKLANGEADWSTALEIAPLGRLARPLWNATTSTRNFIPTLESNMSGIRYAYNRNPELANIGTLEDYNNYLKTVFPESKVKDINYHMGPKGLQELKPSTGKVYNTNPDARGIYVTPDKSYAQRLRKYTTDRLEKPSFFTYIKRNLVPGGWDKANDVFTDIYPVMVDTKNPLSTKGTWTWGIKDKKYQSLMDDYDAIVNSGPKWYQNFNSMPEIIVPKTEQSLILGSDTDVAGFRRFMSNPQITAENELAQNESLKNMFRRILRGKPDDIKITKEMAEMGRKDLLNEISSPWYKERWKKATNGNDEQIDELLSYMKTRIEEVPINYSKTAKQLKDKPGFITHGTTEPRAPLKYKLSDGTPVIDYNTGLDVYVSSDRGKQARGTAYHELQHYLTNNASGTKAFPSLQFIYDDTYRPLSVFTPDRELLIGRGDAWQHYIMDQNDALLPKKSLIYEDAVNNPIKLKDDIIRQGKTSEEADNIISELQDEAQDMMNIQEERAHLKTWFNKEIKPHLNNPNDASEIEQLLKHPNIVKTMPEKVKVLMEKLRPGNIKDYAKYFAESLGVVPFISNTHLKD